MLKQKQASFLHSFVRKPGFPHWTFGYFHSGTICLKTPKEEFCVDAPGVILIAPNVSYTLSSGGQGRRPWRESFAFFSPQDAIAPLLQWSVPIFALNPEDAPLNRKIARRMREANSLFQTKGENRHLWAWNALEEVLLLISEAKPEVITARQDDDRIARSIRYIHDSFSHPLNVDQLAANVHISPSRFAHLFRETVGQTPMQFLEKVRLDHAFELLMETQIPVGEIALRVGFENASHFSQRFRKIYHSSPSDYRLSPDRALITASHGPPRG